MNENFDHILDEALVLLEKGKPVKEIFAMFPDHQKELADILPIAKNLSESLADYTPAFTKTLEKLSERPHTLYNLTAPMHIPPVWLKTIRYSLFSFGKMGAVSLTVLVILIWNGYGVKNHPKAGAGFTTSDGVVMSYANQETGLYNDNLFGNSKPMISQELSLSGGDTRMQLSNAVGAIFGVTTPDPFDTREYLKTNYHATIKTRDITGLGERLKTIIRGHGGRIDYISLNEKTGSIGFIVPKKEYEQFKEELRGLTNKRFITERINENNLVEEKRMLENNAVNANNSIISLNQEKDVLIKNHQRTINSLNTQIVTVKKEIDSLQKQLTGPYFIENKEALELQLQQAQKKLQQLQNQLAYENKTYNQKLSPITASIKNSENQFRNLSDRNTALLTDVEMVNGSIILEWMSLPALFFLLKPFNWILVLLLGVGFVYRNYKKAQAELR